MLVRRIRQSTKWFERPWGVFFYCISESPDQKHHLYLFFKANFDIWCNTPSPMKHWFFFFFDDSIMTFQFSPDNMTKRQKDSIYKLVFYITLGEKKSSSGVEQRRAKVFIWWICPSFVPCRYNVAITTGHPITLRDIIRVSSKSNPGMTSWNVWQSKYSFPYVVMFVWSCDRALWKRVSDSGTVTQIYWSSSSTE